MPYLHGVLDSDFQVIPPLRSDCGTWILAVDEETESLAMAVGITGAVGDLKVVCYCVAGRWELLVEVGGDAEAIRPTGAC